MHTLPGTASHHDVAALGDEQLLARLRQLLSQERKLSARVLVHLGEVDARGLYRDQAYASMFDYCVQALHLSEAEADLRIRAASAPTRSAYADNTTRFRFPDIANTSDDVLHEMLHLIERTHGPRFVALMDQFMPQWRQTRKLLNSLPARHDRWTY
jgi:hypothetical protein